jgi:ribonuclease D
MVFHNSHLMSIARYKPFNLADLEQITGLGELKIRRFGVEILEVLENA